MTRALVIVLLALAIASLVHPQATYAQEEDPDPCMQDDPPPPPECFEDPPTYAVGVIPDGGLQPTRQAQTTGYSAVFTVTNTGNTSDFYSLDCSSTGPVVCTSLSVSSVALDPGASTTVTVFYDVGVPGTGTLYLGAHGTMTDFGYYTVPVVSYGVSVIPDGATSATRTTNTGGHSETFTVTNTGSASNTFSFTCSGAAGVTCGAVPAAVTLAASGQAGSQTTVTMPYSVGAPGTGTLTLTASGTNASNPGSYSVPIVSYGVAVTPDGGTAPTRTANTGGHSETFTVGNTGSAPNTYSFTCSGVGGVTCGAVPAAVTLGAGLQTTVSMPYSVGAPGTGTLTLTANGTNASNPGSYSVPIVSYGVAVTPDGGAAPTRPANSGGFSESFTVQNTGSGQNTYTFTCSGAGGVTCGSPPTPVTLGAGLSTSVSQSYSVGAPGTGTLTLTATGTAASNPGSYSVPIQSFGVAVTPDGAVGQIVTQNTSGHTAVFTVLNTGGGSNTYTLTCSGASGVTCTNLSAASVALNAGQSATVTATFNVGAAGTGTLTVSASGSYASDAGSYAVPVISFVPSVISAGVFTKDSRYLLQETAERYDNWGRIDSLTDARGKATSYGYGGNANNAFLIRLTRWKDGTGSINLATDIAYDNDGFVESIKDEGGSFKYFTYDLFGRLRQVKNNAGTPVRAYGYTYSRTSPSWNFIPNSPNAIVDTTFIQQAPLQTVVSTGFFDGLGRPIQTAVRDATNYHVSATQYDPMGRVWRVWKPYTRTTAGYDPAFTTNATTFYTTYHGTTAKPYTETAYTADALARVKQVTPEYLGATPTAFTTYAYGVEPGPKHQYTEVADESGKRTRRFSDLLGNQVKAILGYGTAEASTTLFASNVVGQRTQVTDPRNLIITYALDTRGLLIAGTSPDAGTINHKYDKAGNRRFTQDANQAAAGQVFFISYDFAGRPTTAGQGAATFASLDPDAAPTALETTQDNWLVVRQYDAQPPVAFPWNLFPPPPPLANVAGRLAALATKSNGAWQASFFSYDADGEIATRYTYTQGNGGTAPPAALHTTIVYTRDLRGSLTERRVTVGTNTFNHWYDYDGRGLLWKVFASTGSGKPAAADVTDTYRPSGQTQEYVFLRSQGTPQTVPLRYTIREQLERIGDPSLTTFPFSARYAYHANGTVAEAEFYSDGSPAAQKRYRYQFPTYDGVNRLKSADFSSWSGSAWTVTQAYDLANIGYDASGNLLSLQRYRETATLVDNLTYVNAAGSNRLTSVTDAVVNSAETWDAETGSFTYDANGNLKTATASPFSITATTYDHQNLPLSITRTGTTTTYRYNETGQRLAKQVGAGNTEMYILDGALTLGVFTINGSGGVVSSYFNILTDKRVVGRETSTGTRTYYHQDLLASTRAVVLSTTGAVVESYDFEPWGLLMAGRTFGSGTKEWFTGKERDAETGLDYFGARYYMAAIGRWTSVDPEAATMPEWSTYNYVFNNPAGFIDALGKQAQSIVKEANTYWDNVAIAGHQQGRFWGNAKAGFATVMSTVIEYGGLNAMDQGTDAIAEGNLGKGLVQTGLGIAAMAPIKIPGLNFLDEGAHLANNVDNVDDLAKAGSQLDNTAPAAARPTRHPNRSTRAGADEAATDAQGKLRCQYCQQEVTPEPGHPNSRNYEHMDPYSQGGGSGPDNIVVSCRTCNLKKGAQTILHWLIRQLLEKEENR